MREIPEQCWDKQSHFCHKAHWTAPQRLEYALWQTGQGHVGVPGFCSISSAKRIREWRFGEVSHSHLQKCWCCDSVFCVLCERLPGPHAGRAPPPEGREQKWRRNSAPDVDVSCCRRLRQACHHHEQAPSISGLGCSWVSSIPPYSSKI